MHPLFTHRGALAGYLAGCVVALGLLIYILAAAAPVRLLEAAATLAPAVAVHAFACLTPWYLCRAFPLRRAAVPRIVAVHVVDALASSAIFVFVSLGAAWLLRDTFPGLPGRLEPRWLLLFNVALLYFLLSSAVHCVIAVAEESRDAERRETAALVEARDAELRALRAQLSPHFLFNSLHSIGALAGADPPRAKEMCVRLSEYLRGTLGMSATEAVPLARELEMVRNYLEIERVRFGSRLEFQEQIEYGCGALPVPALLLQPLIENAIKHGISNLLDGGVVRVEARRTAAELLIAVENTFDAEAPAPRRTGIGLALVRKRLAARYGDAAWLRTGAEGSRFFARLRLPSETIAARPAL